MRIKRFSEKSNSLDFRLWLENIEQSTAYWISPDGVITSLPHKIHIEAIIKDPERFGFTQEEVQAKFDKYGEHPSQEGRAREELMVDAMNRGWIRIRKYNRPDFFSIQTGVYDRSFYRRLEDWVIKMIQAGHAHKFSDMRITAYDGSRPTEKYEFIEFLRRAA